MTAATGRVWTLQFMAPCAWILANRNSAHERYSRSSLVRGWRRAMVDCCSCGDVVLPCGEDRLDLIAIDATARFRGRAPVRDSDNLGPTLKAVKDALAVPRRHGKHPPAAGYGLIPEDSDKHVAHAEIRIGEPLPRSVWEGHPGLLIVRITELIPANARLF